MKRFALLLIFIGFAVLGIVLSITCYNAGVKQGAANATLGSVTHTSSAMVVTEQEGNLPTFYLLVGPKRDTLAAAQADLDKWEECSGK